MGLLQLILLAGALILLAGLVLKLLNPLPQLPDRKESHAFPAADSRLSRSVADEAAAHPGRSGVALLSDGMVAFATRAGLARAADHSLDLQYYIWQDDVSARLLMRELIDAADRGVRVRLLLDDNGTAGLDVDLSALDSHPEIEVRLFNPFVIRRPKAVGYIMDFRRLNRRMHNKAFIADGAAAVIGGRNVGDEYFGATRGSEFEDLDLLAFGPVVPQLSADFDLYWSAQSSYPVASILPPPTEGALADLRRKLGEEAARQSAAGYAAAIQESLLPGAGLAQGPELEWAMVSMLSDDPAKSEGRVERGALLADQLVARVGPPDRRLSLISAYFVPGRLGTAGLVAAAGRGIEVDVLTNALESTDVAAVHAGYARHRKALLRAGVRLWELKSEPRNHRTRLRLGIGSRPGSRPVILSSGSSLHAKTLAVDGRRLFVGSFNFDPRSVALNTELGFLVESPRLADQLHTLFAADIRSRAYEVRLSPGGDLVWVEETPQGPIAHEVEPGTRLHQRLAVKALSLLPIDWLL